MKSYVRNDQEIGKIKEICEYLDPDRELRHCMRGKVVESGISSARLANGKMLSQEVDYLETKHYGTVLFLDKMVQTCDCPEHEAPYHETMVHVPMIEHPNPERVLVLGGGDGAIVREVFKHREVEACVLVELDQNIVELSKKFIPNCARIFMADDPRLQIVFEDCIGYLKETATPESFDVVIVDLVDVIDADVQASRQFLYDSQFYELVRKTLTPDGIMITHVGGLAQIDMAVIKNVYRELFKVFTNAKPLSVYVPLFLLQWAFCIASKNTGFLWNSLDSQQKHRIRDLTGPTFFYDNDFHSAVFQENHWIRQILDSNPVGL